MRINPDGTQSFGYAFDDLMIVDLRLIFGWTLSPACWGVPAEAVVLSRHITIETMRLLEVAA